MLTGTREYVNGILQSGLMDDVGLRSALAAIQTNHDGVLPSDAKVIASELIGGGHLSEWQAKNILKGKLRGFFLGKYKLIRQLGAGGMSIVYLGEHIVMRKRFAIKVLPKRLSERENSVTRFQQEARACAMLEHPNIVRVTDFDTVNDRHFMVMEFVDGIDLQKMVRERGVLPVERAIDFLKSIASALQHAHERGIVHRDIKPQNMLINRDGMIKLSDLGLARLYYDHDERLDTVKGALVGTADYLAPEQAQDSRNADGRADLYSLGCTLYFMLAGRAPFAEGGLKERIAKHQTMPAPDPRKLREDCPAEVSAICLRLLEKSPHDRFQTATQLLATLNRLPLLMSVGASTSVPVVPSALGGSGGSSASIHSLSSASLDTSIADGVLENTVDNGNWAPVAGQSSGGLDDFFGDLSDSGSSPSLDVDLGGAGVAAGPTSFAPDQGGVASAAQFASQGGQSSFVAPGQNQPAANPKKSTPPSPSVSPKLVAGIATAVLAVIFSIVMVVMQLTDNGDSRQYIKTSEGNSKVIFLDQ